MQLALHALWLKQASSAMESTVDNLLAVYTTGNVVADMAAPFPAATLLAHARSTTEFVAQNAGPTVQLGELTQATVRFDYAQMLRVLCTLIGNCVQYRQAGSTVVLAAEVEVGQVVISVSDAGPA